MDFLKGLKLRTPTSGVKRTIKAILEDGIWYARVNSKLYPIADADDISKCKILYSKAGRTDHEDWTKTKLPKPIIAKNLAIAGEFWCKFKPGLIITGELKLGIFYTNK